MVLITLLCLSAEHTSSCPTCLWSRLESRRRKRTPKSETTAKHSKFPVFYIVLSFFFIMHESLLSFVYNQQVMSISFNNDNTKARLMKNKKLGNEQSCDIIMYNVQAAMNDSRSK